MISLIGLSMLLSTSFAYAGEFVAYVNFYRCDLPRYSKLIPPPAWDLAFGESERGPIGAYSANEDEGFWYRAFLEGHTFFQFSISGLTFTVPNTMLVRENPATKAVIRHGTQISSRQKETTCELVDRK